VSDRKDIRYTDECLRMIGYSGISPRASAAMIRIISFVASRMVERYYDCNDPDPEGLIDLDDGRMARVAGETPAMWRKILKEIREFFEKTEHGYRLLNVNKLIEIKGRANTSHGTARPSLSPVLRMYIGNRDGWTCGYCGKKDGPFDIDHIVPISRGGALTDTDNLICACAKCNRSKGDKLVAEWVS
jgi:hypothetical protein